MEIKDIKAVYFVGAGGIGMSAIARYFLSKKLVVAGYDKTPSNLTHELEKEGMLIHYEENVDLIPEACKDAKTTLVVYTPAIPAEHKELVFFHENGFTIEKRAQVLGTLTRTHKGLCVAGTHGKTSTSTMCAHIMHQSHIDCNAFLGGISKNYGTNYILSDKSDYVVIEADEFDRSFHWLRPWMSVITATDPDHLDIYGTKEAYLESFRHYTELIQPGGALIIHKGLEMKQHVQDGVKIYEYSQDEGDFHAENIKIENGGITFDFISPIENVTGVELGQPVPINITNGVAAMAMAQLNGCTADELRNGILESVGATIPSRDIVDQRIVEEVRTGQAYYVKKLPKKNPYGDFWGLADKSKAEDGSFKYRRLDKDSYKLGIITDICQVGGFPKYKKVKPYVDTDGDGMPDEWEIANGLNPNDPSDANKDCTGDGYTNIEKYINGISTKEKVDWTDMKNNHDTLAEKGKLL